MVKKLYGSYSNYIRNKARQVECCDSGCGSNISSADLQRLISETTPATENAIGGEINTFISFNARDYVDYAVYSRNGVPSTDLSSGSTTSILMFPKSLEDDYTVYSSSGISYLATSPADISLIFDTSINRIYDGSGQKQLPISNFNTGDRFLIAGQVDKRLNGIYIISEISIPSLPTSFGLTRASDLLYDTSITGLYVFDQNSRTGFYQNPDPSTVLVGTDNLNFIVFSQFQRDFEAFLTEIKPGSGNIDISTSGIGQIFTIDLSSNLDLSNITLDGSLVLHSNNNNSISIFAPPNVTQPYNLILPEKKPDVSGAFMRIDGSGQLYFDDLSAGSNLTYDISRNIIGLNSEIDVSQITIDSSLVFFLSDTSKVTITVPQDVSSYTLKLPKAQADTSGAFMRVDASGQLYFDPSFSSDISHDLSGSKNIDVSYTGTRTVISLQNEIDLSTVKLDTSLVFYTDTSSITIVAPSTFDTSYTLTLPDKAPSNEISGAYMRVDGLGHLYFDPSFSSDISRDLSGSKNIDVSYTGTRTVISLQNEIDLSTVILDTSLVFQSNTNGNTVSIGISSEFIESYNLTLPARDPSTAIYNKETKIPSENALITVNKYGVMDFASMDKILENTTLGIQAHEAVKYATDPKDLSDNLTIITGSGPGADAVLLFTQDTNKIGDISLVNDFSNGDRILINGQQNQFYNGIYDVSHITLDNSMILTRSNDFDGSPSSSEIANTYVFVQDGIYSNTAWILSYRDSKDITIGDHSINFVQFTGDSINFNSGENISIDPDPVGNTQTISLKPSISVHEVIIDNSLVFTTGTDKITIIPPLDVSYTLRLPGKAPSTEISGAFMRVDGSGHLYFDPSFSSDISRHLSGGKNIDVSYIDGSNIISLQSNIDLSTVKIDTSLVFQVDNSSITIVAPSTFDTSYTLTLPDKAPSTEISGAFMRVDASGQLYFDPSFSSDIFIDLSGSKNIDVSLIDSSTVIFLNSNIDISTVTIDTSLVFQVGDSSSITIVAPSDISKNYRLILPTDLSNSSSSDNKQIICVDNSGNLSFNSVLNSDTIFINSNNKFDLNKSLFNQQPASGLEITLNNFIGRQLLNQGIPLIYFLPSMTFNSSRQSNIDMSFQYYNYNLDEFNIYKSTIKYINEKNLLHAINFNSKNNLTFFSIQNIITAYIDSINNFQTTPFFNIISNDYYLKVLNLSSILKNSKSPSLELLFNNNNNIATFIKTLTNIKVFENFNFSNPNIPCIINSGLIPAYYYDISSSTKQIDFSYNPNILNNELIKVLPFGDIEYNQNFIAIKNAIDNSNIIPNNNDNKSKNIVFYFYCQDTNNKPAQFTNLLSTARTRINFNYWNPITHNDVFFGYDGTIPHPIDGGISINIPINSINFPSSFGTLEKQNATITNTGTTGVFFDISYNGTIALNYYDNTQISSKYYWLRNGVTDISLWSSIAVETPHGSNTMIIHNATANIDKALTTNEIYFVIEYNDRAYRIDYPQWLWTGRDHDGGSSHPASLPAGINLNMTLPSETYAIEIGFDISIISTTTNNLTDFSMGGYIIDHSDVLLYDYGNILFSLDNSFNNDLSFNTSNTYDKVLIPSIYDLERFNALIDNCYNYINKNTSCNIALSADFEYNHFKVNTLSEQLYKDIELNYDISYISDISINENFEFIDCISNNSLSGIDISTINSKLFTNEISNILIICPLAKEKYRLQQDSNDNISFLTDKVFNNSLSKYYPLISFFQTLQRTKTSDISYNISFIVSTNESDTINNMMFDKTSGTAFKKKPTSPSYYYTFENNIFFNNGNNIFLTYYDTPNKFYDKSKFQEPPIIPADASYNLYKVTSSNINNNNINTNNLIDKIILTNYNILDNDILPDQKDNINSHALLNNSTINSIINAYALYILYENEANYNILDIMYQIKSKSRNLIYDYYKHINTTSNDLSSVEIIKYITGFSSEKIELNEVGYNKLLNDLNFNFYQLDPSNDYITTTDDLVNKYYTEDSDFYNFKLSILLLHYYKNKTNTFFYNNKNDNSYNIVDFKYYFGVNSSSNNEMLDISHSYEVNNNLDNFNLLKKWKDIYTDPHQYLTIAD